MVFAALLLQAASCRPSDPPDQRRHVRQQRRAYDGAPPVIPHAVAELGRQDCLECHLKGLDLFEHGLASPTPHPHLRNCVQCHLEQDSQARPRVANRFQGHRNPPRGGRPYPGAPPTIPHSLIMRSQCLACHGPLGGSPLRTSHPERTNCLQCHLAQQGTAWPEGRAAGGAPHE